jgi:hypothetical protein
MRTYEVDGRRAGHAVVLLVALLVAGLLPLAGCGNDDGAEEGPPDEVLAAAKAALDSTSGVALSLTTAE